MQAYIVVDVPKEGGGREAGQQLALRIIRILADSLGVKYEITKD